MKYLVVGIIFSLVAAGCATIDSLQPGGGGKTFEVRGKSYNVVWNAAVSAASHSFTIVENNKEEGNLRAEKGTELGTTCGEMLDIFIRPTTSDASVYTVEVQTVKRARLQITGQDWTSTIISEIKADLDQ